MRPQFSVTIAAYNHGKFIKEAINSVLSQTAQDFEIIVLDDGSTDGTRAIVGSIKDDRIRYIYQPNSGFPAAGRNKAISLSSGRYIALLDGDDYWERGKLENAKAALDRDAGAALVCHNEAVVYKGKILRRTSYGPYSADMYSRLLFKGNSLHSSAVMIRREVFFDDDMRFDERKSLFTVEDYDYWLRLSGKYKFIFLPEVLGYYRVTEEGAFLSSGAANADNMLNLLDENFKKMNVPDAATRNAMRRRRSSVMAAAGRVFNHKKEFYNSRAWYLKAIAEYPANLKAYAGLAASALHHRIIYR